MPLAYDIKADTVRNTPNSAPASYARSSAATTAVPENPDRTHRNTGRIWPAVPSPASSAVGSTATSAGDDWGLNDFEGKEGLENIDRLAQHCTFVRQQIELLISRLDDKIGDMHYHHHTGWTCPCATTARERQQQEENKDGQWMSDVKCMLGQLQQQLQQLQRTQEMTERLVRMDEQSWRLKTQQLELAVDSLEEEMREFRVKRRQDEEARSLKAEEEREVKQSEQVDRVKQMEDVMRRLEELENLEKQKDVKDDEQDEGQDDRDWFYITQNDTNTRRKVEGEGQPGPPPDPFW